MRLGAWRWGKFTLRNALPAALWFGFALGSVTAFLRHGSPLSLVMGGVNLLIAALFLLRRPDAPPRDPGPLGSDAAGPEAKGPGRGAWPTALAWIGTFLPFFLRPAGVLTPLSAGMQIIGMIAILLSLGALGRSFGLSPARRDIVTRGPYGWVRHPLYAAELLYFLGIVIAAPQAANLTVWGALALIQVRRALNEERCLAEDARYRDYLEAVRFRFVPGLV